MYKEEQGVLGSVREERDGVDRELKGALVRAERGREGFFAKQSSGK